MKSDDTHAAFCPSPLVLSVRGLVGNAGARLKKVDVDNRVWGTLCRGVGPNTMPEQSLESSVGLSRGGRGRAVTGGVAPILWAELGTRCGGRGSVGRS